MIRSLGDIPGELARAGYSLVPSDRFEFDARTTEAFVEFCKLWDQLTPDPYLKPESGRRLRRYARFYYDPAIARLHQLPNAPYYQATLHNRLYGGIERRFDPFISQGADNLFFREFVEFCIHQLPGFGQKAVPIHAHMVRIVANTLTVGQPSPEGMHQDGFTFISIHLIRRHNVLGGETELANLPGNAIARSVLSRPLDSLYVNDRLLHHGTSAIKPAGPGESFRDVLLLSYGPASDDAVGLEL